ncbi:MAG: DUF456 domain-containing protein [Candidatus Paceibacterota bacterium]|jgi:hypothetical protein
MTETILIIGFAVLMLPALGLVFIPFAPTLPYLVLVSLIFSALGSFKALTFKELGVLGLLWLISILVDSFSGLLGARYGGASRQAMLWGLIGALVGSFLLPFGPLAGLFLGVLIGEIYGRRGPKSALKAATGSLIGTLAGIIINLVIVVTFITLFLVFAF